MRKLYLSIPKKRSFERTMVLGLATMRITTTIILAFISASFQTIGQTYSTIVPDSIVANFINDVLTNVEPYENAFNKLPKKVYYKPIHLREASWDLRELPDSTPFEIKFDELLKRVALTNEDIEFLKTQYVGSIDTTWRLSIDHVTFKRKYKRKRFKYSIPIFTADYQTAVFWRYQYCGSLCAYSELHTYKLVGGRWKLDRLIGGWIA